MITVVYQGPSTFYNVIQKSNKYRTIFSTWDDEPKKNIENLLSRGFDVVTTTKPNFVGNKNINLQTISSISGISLAETEYVIKIRSDILITNIDYFLDFLLEINKMCFLAYHQHEDGYVCDYINFGPKQQMLMWWSYFQKEETHDAPETQLLNNFLRLKNINNSLEEIKKHFYFFLPDLVAKDFDLIWLKHGVNFKSYLDHKLYKF